MNKFALLAVLTLALAPLSRAAEVPVKMETRIHTFTPYTVEHCVTLLAEGTNSPEERMAARDAALKTLMERHGMEFPSGAFIRNEFDQCRIVLRNTAAEQVKFRRVLAALNLDNHNLQVAADFSFVAFERTDVEKVARQNASAAPSSEALIALWKAGKGRLVTAQTIVTRSGVNAQLQSTEEIIYPTEFAAGTERGTNATERMTNPILVPGSFETREVGVIANFTPTIGPDGRTIDMSMWSEISQLAETNRFTANYGPANAQQRSSIEQPVFNTGHLATALVMRDGSTLVLGDIAPHGLKERYYLFLTARIVDATGGKPGETDTSILVDEPAKP